MSRHPVEIGPPRMVTLYSLDAGGARGPIDNTTSDMQDHQATLSRWRREYAQQLASGELRITAKRYDEHSPALAL